MRVAATNVQEILKMYFSITLQDIILCGDCGISAS
jgi:hypothetical protein